MSDDEDDQVNSDGNLFDGSDCTAFGPLVPTENERSLMERVRQELRHELKQVNRCGMMYMSKHLNWSPKDTQTN